jgi:4-diphosphocytidyl-2-C-methyl-D-erythritol kinase
LIHSAFAPAKVNLFLHVGPLQDDGYHPVCSLMTFADVGDRILLEPADTIAFAVTGDFAGGLNGQDDNLVLRAARGLIAAAGATPAPFRLTLDKALPIAAGLGGGSSDAGAALRLLRQALALDVADTVLEEVALSLGADGLVCLGGRPIIGQGRGDVLSPAPRMPVLHAVLVNPSLPSHTGAVYRAFDDLGAPGSAARPALPDAFESAAHVAEVLADCRNDLEAPAVRLQPAIRAVLDTLKALPEVLLARMSGSGATCFALCAGAEEAQALAGAVAAMRLGWWIRACRLGGPWPD